MLNGPSGNRVKGIRRLCTNQKRFILQLIDSFKFGIQTDYLTGTCIISTVEYNYSKDRKLEGEESSVVAYTPTEFSFRVSLQVSSPRIKYWYYAPL
jgi:hypothetical protein